MIGLKISNLRLNVGAFSLLICLVTLGFLLYSLKLYGKSLVFVGLLHGQHDLQALILPNQYLKFVFVSTELLLKTADGVVQVVQLALGLSGI